MASEVREVIEIYHMEYVSLCFYSERNSKLLPDFEQRDDDTHQLKLK